MAQEYPVPDDTQRDRKVKEDRDLHFSLTLSGLESLSKGTVV